MNKEEIESFKELNTDLEDIDDLDMGLEIISYKVRTTMQEFANTIINLQSQLDIANNKLDKIKNLVKTKTYKEFKLYYSNGTKDEILEEFYEDYKQLSQLHKEKEELIKYCENEIFSQNKSIVLLSNKKYADIHIGAINAYKNVLSKLKESEKDVS